MTHLSIDPCVHTNLDRSCFPHEFLPRQELNVEMHSVQQALAKELVPRRGLLARKAAKGTVAQVKPPDTEVV